MEENLKWLWAAFSVAWALHIGYMMMLSGREKNLRRQIEDLKGLLKEQTKSDG